MKYELFFKGLGGKSILGKKNRLVQNLWIKKEQPYIWVNEKSYYVRSTEDNERFFKI